MKKIEKEYQLWNNSFISEIQGLRCIAILMVILFHVPLILNPEQMSYYQKFGKYFATYTGVELFFVLAGFFLMKSLVKIENGEERGNKLFEFILKKFKRLAPASYLWIFVALLFCIITKNGDYWLDKSLMLKQFFSTLLWLRNFEEALLPTHLGYFWAISLEFQFFLIFSIIYLVLGKRKTLYLSLVICFVMMFFRLSVNFQSWLFRFDPMLWGVVVYYVFEKIDKDIFYNQLKTNKFCIFLISCILILLLASSEITFGGYKNLKTSISSMISAIMLLLALSGNGYFYFKISVIKHITDWIGSRSYSLYCCHIVSWFVIKQLYTSLEIEYNNQGFFYCIIFMLISTELTYRYIEKSLLKNKE